MAFLSSNCLPPIKPTTYFDGANVQEAFRSLQKGQHIGKLVVRMPTDPARLPTSSTSVEKTFQLRADASYLLVGGLGGLGRSVATWLAEHGARSLVLLSRSGSLADPETSAFSDELAAMGCEMQVVAGNVACLEDVRRAVRQAQHPIAGVLQMAMVLRDGAFAQMSHEDWTAAIEPKVQGTWNLHSALGGHGLDFFVLFSSYSGLVGNPGQANYAAANTFLDAFVQYRHSHGLPASVLDIGVMGDVGYVSQNQTIMEHFQARAAHLLREQDLLDSLALAMQRSRPQATSKESLTGGYYNESQLGIGFRMTQPISSPSNRSIWRRDARMSLYRNRETAVSEEDSGSSGGMTESDSLKDYMTNVAQNAKLLAEPSTAGFLGRSLGEALFDFMMRPVEELDVSTSPKASGMDSLVATELKTWCRQRLGVDLSVLEIVGANSFEQLGSSVAKGLTAKLGLQNGVAQM